MGWSHPDISLEDLLNLIKGFVDILILASGYQSSGHAAVWDAENIKKAMRWGLFFEDVFRRLCNSENYQDSVKELDAALFELTSDSYFPQGLTCLSSTTLSKARDFVLECLFQTLPLRDAHLNALLAAVIEMDLDGLAKIDDDPLSLYIEKMMLQTESLNLIPGERSFIKGSIASFSTADSRNPNDPESERVPRSPINFPNIKAREMRGDDHSSFIVQEILKRQAAVSCLSSVETSLDTLLDVVTKNNLIGFESNMLEEKLHDGLPPVKEETLTGFVLWKQWRSSALSYLFDRRTIRLLSGANLIFGAPKSQWVQVFEPLKVSTEGCNDNLLEIIELSLLGLLSSRWTCLIRHLMSLSCDLLPISKDSKQFYDVHNLLQGISQFSDPDRKRVNCKENDILEYLKVLLGSQPHQLWKLPPILAAAATSLCSMLFRSYSTEIERQLKGDSSPIRCCTCIQHGKEHKDCEVSERVWCLYMFHIQGSHLTVDCCEG